MMEKCAEPLQKKTMGVTFLAQNQLLTFSLSTKHTFLCTQPKLARGKSSSCRFSFSAARNAVTQVKYVIFGFIFVFRLLLLLGNFERHCLFEIRIVY